MELTITQIKDIVANVDADVYIVRKDYVAVEDFVREAGYSSYNIPMSEIRIAVDMLQDDPYIKMLIGKGFGK